MAERERKGKREVSKKASAAAEVGFGERQLAREIVCFIPIVRPRIPCQRNNVVGGCVIKKNTTLVTFYHVFCPRAYKIKSEGGGEVGSCTIETPLMEGNYEFALATESEELANPDPSVYASKINLMSLRKSAPHHSWVPSLCSLTREGTTH